MRRMSARAPSARSSAASAGSAARRSGTRRPSLRVTRPRCTRMKASKPEQRAQQRQPQRRLDDLVLARPRRRAAWWCMSRMRAVWPTRSSSTPSQMKSSGVSCSIVLRTRPEAELRRAPDVPVELVAVAARTAARLLARRTTGRARWWPARSRGSAPRGSSARSRARARIELRSETRVLVVPGHVALDDARRRRRPRRRSARRSRLLARHDDDRPPALPAAAARRRAPARA